MKVILKFCVNVQLTIFSILKFKECKQNKKQLRFIKKVKYNLSILMVDDINICMYKLEITNDNFNR